MTAALSMSDKPMHRTREPWPQAIQDDLARNRTNGADGTRLHSARSLPNYFWPAETAGKALSHEEDGTAVVGEYSAGETRHARYAKGEYKVHDLQNVGMALLVFTRVELEDSANAPLPVSEWVSS